MIFYKPLKEFVIKQGIPNYYPKEYEEEFFRRVAIANNQTLEEAMNDEENIEYLKEINTPIERSLDKETLEAISEQIKKWIQ
jgi:tripartite-type tricarboxylate transporter receptor subunit TctC